MGVVRMKGTTRVCATCAFWRGQRQEADGEYVFNNRDLGVCCGASFSGFSMGAISTCREWAQGLNSRPEKTTTQPGQKSAAVQTP